MADHDFLRKIGIYESANFCRDRGEFSAADLLYEQSFDLLEASDLAVFVKYDWALCADFQEDRQRSLRLFSDSVALYEEFARKNPSDARVESWRYLIDGVKEHVVCVTKFSLDMVEYGPALARRLRWPKRCQLKVFVEQGKEKGFDDETTKLIFDSCNTWIDGGVPVVIEQSYSDADADVTFVKTPVLGNPSAGAFTQFILQGEEVISKAVISILAVMPESSIKSSFSRDKFCSLVAHEFGHALGIDGHSPFGKDLMYWKSNQLKPSKRDIQTVLAIWSTDL
jgi:hypothetical protein